MVKRRVYDKEFKLMLIDLLESGRSISSVSEEFDIRRDTISKWRRSFREAGAASFSGQGKSKLTDQERENLRLKRELKSIKEERDILKKAVSIFSKSGGKYTGL